MSEKKEIKYLSVKEVAEILGKPRPTIIDHCNMGLFEGAKKIGDYPRAPWIIPEESLKTYKPPTDRRRERKEKAAQG